MAKEVHLPVNFSKFLPSVEFRKLDNAKLYVGMPNQDPRQFPVNVFFDSHLTVFAPPVLTIKNGFIYHNGDIVDIFVAETAVSLLLLDVYGRQLLYVAGEATKLVCDTTPSGGGSGVPLIPLVPATPVPSTPSPAPSPSPVPTDHHPVLEWATVYVIHAKLPSDIQAWLNWVNQDVVPISLNHEVSWVMTSNDGVYAEPSMNEGLNTMLYQGNCFAHNMTELLSKLQSYAQTHNLGTQSGYLFDNADELGGTTDYMWADYLWKMPKLQHPERYNDDELMALHIANQAEWGDWRYFMPASGWYPADKDHDPGAWDFYDDPHVQAFQNLGSNDYRHPEQKYSQKVMDQLSTRFCIEKSQINNQNKINQMVMTDEIQQAIVSKYGYFGKYINNYVKDYESMIDSSTGQVVNATVPYFLEIDRFSLAVAHMRNPEMLTRSANSILKVPVRVLLVMRMLTGHSDQVLIK